MRRAKRGGRARTHLVSSASSPSSPPPSSSSAFSPPKPAPAPEPPTPASLMPPAVCLTARQRTSPVSISSPVSSFHMTGSSALASLKYSLPVSMSV
jgi:hypothetical protein